jgi:hypothetical protein
MCINVDLIWARTEPWNAGKSSQITIDPDTGLAISFYFYLYLMLHACDQRFDVMENLENFDELNKA